LQRLTAIVLTVFVLFLLLRVVFGGPSATTAGRALCPALDEDRRHWWRLLRFSITHDRRA